jgi:hypothetical protein
MFQFLVKIARALDKYASQKEGHSMSPQMREDFRSPSVNVDGTPMVGPTDIHGRGYGSGGSTDLWRS